MSLRILGRIDLPMQNEKFVHRGVTYKAVMASAANDCQGCAFASGFSQCDAAPKCGYFGENFDTSFVFKPVIRVENPPPLEVVEEDGQTKIGVPFIMALDGEKYVAKANERCDGCYFIDGQCVGTPICSGNFAGDRISRIFVKVQA